MDYKQLLITLGISDIQALLNYINATSKTGPQFKTAASNAINALSELGIAAENPNQ